ncbi:MAG: 5-formyltetrahydrofolate cyclo-ligase [Gammaproteobacteria bacterium]
MIPTTRQILRLSMQQQRSQLTPAQQHSASEQACHFIAAQSWFKQSQHIAFYWAVRGEINLHPLIQQAAQRHKKCYLPVCHPSQNILSFAPYQPGDALCLNPYKIPEPCSKPFRQPAELDLIFMPLLAFDARGNRLGSGQGYYDRTLAYLNTCTYQRKPQRVGVAYDFQQVPMIEAESWDVPLDTLVIYSETGIKSLIQIQ